MNIPWVALISHRGLSRDEYRRRPDQVRRDGKDDPSRSGRPGGVGICIILK
jgi:hypothetical protein